MWVSVTALRYFPRDESLYGRMSKPMSVRQAVPLVADPLHPVYGLAGDNLHVGGACSCALPGHAGAREVLAHPFDDRLFFAGEAMHGTSRPRRGPGHCFA